jgi:hypothetical protein
MPPELIVENTAQPGEVPGDGHHTSAFSQEVSASAGGGCPESEDARGEASHERVPQWTADASCKPVRTCWIKSNCGFKRSSAGSLPFDPNIRLAAI